MWIFNRNLNNWERICENLKLSKHQNTGFVVREETGEKTHFLLHPNCSRFFVAGCVGIMRTSTPMNDERNPNMVDPFIPIRAAQPACKLKKEKVFPSLAHTLEHK